MNQNLLNDSLNKLRIVLVLLFKKINELNEKVII
jgi:hypothetical protein